MSGYTPHGSPSSFQHPPHSVGILQGCPCGLICGDRDRQSVKIPSTPHHQQNTGATSQEPAEEAGKLPGQDSALGEAL